MVGNLERTVGAKNAFAIFKAAYEAVQSKPIRSAEEAELATIRARNAARLEATRAIILADAVNSDAAGQFLSRTRPIVNKLANAGGLVAIKDGRSLRFPRWQFDETSEDGLVPGFQRTLSAMDASPFRKAAWFIRPNRHLDNRAPIEALRDGDIDRVYQEAKTVNSS